VRVADENSPEKIYRNFEFGDLLNLVMLDTRIVGRDEQVKSKTLITDSLLNLESRSLLGTEQLQWFSETVKNNNGKWLMVGQQIMLSPLLIHNPLNNKIKIGNADQWDGYPAERNRFFDIIEKNNISNLVVLSGDIHTAWSCNIPMNNYHRRNGKNSYGVEFITASVTSRNLGKKIPLVSRGVRAMNPHVKFVDGYAHGYFLLTISNEKVFCEHIFVSNIKS